MDKPYLNKDDKKPRNNTHSNYRWRRSSSRWIYPIIIIIALLLIWHFYAKFHKKKPVVPPIPISVAAASTANVPVFIPALGSVTSIDTITVHTQVNGQLLQVLYREGQIVKRGQLLAQIDPRPFLAQLIQFQGTLEHDLAQLANARIDLRRYKLLYPVGAVSQQTYETQKALVKQLEGTVQFDKGQIDTVKVNLIYTRITSPINGRVGLRLVDPGNFVQTTDTTGLVVINVVQPITVIFSIPEDNVPEVLEQISKGKNLLVQAYDRTQNKLLSTGTLLTIDNQIDQTTGTVKLRAQFQNQDFRLFPEQFVNVQLLVTTLPNATIAPTVAIQHGPNGTFVFVLNKNNTVTVTPVTTGVTYGDNTVIISGVSPGQVVAVEGGDKLNDGSNVTVIKSEKGVGATTPAIGHAETIHKQNAIPLLPVPQLKPHKNIPPLPKLAPNKKIQPLQKLPPNKNILPPPRKFHHKKNIPPQQKFPPAVKVTPIKNTKSCPLGVAL